MKVTYCDVCGQDGGKGTRYRSDHHEGGVYDPTLYSHPAAWAGDLCKNCYARVLAFLRKETLKETNPWVEGRGIGWK